MIKKCVSMLLSAATAALFFTGNTTSNFTSAHEQEPVEIISLRSEYEKHFDNGDGTITAFIDTVPLHYYDDGEWVEIDNTLIQDESGNYVNRGNSMNVTLASSASVHSLDSVDNNQTVSVDYNGYSISWDFINEQPEAVAYSSIEKMSETTADISINNSEYMESISLGNSAINEKVAESVSNLESSVSYNSLYNNVDVDIDIRPSSVKETINLNNRHSVPEYFSYYIQIEGLNAEVYEDNSVHFLNENQEDVFIIPTPYMFDSSDNAENNYDIGIEIEDYEDGYLMTLIPDIEWILSSERVYPVMIDPVVETVRNNITVTTLSEAYPGSYITGDTVKIGGDIGDRYETLVSCSGIFSNYNSSTVVTDAKFYMYLCPHSYQGKIDIYSINQRYMPYWGNCGGDNTNSTYISTTEVPISYITKYTFDITKLTQCWLNYLQTGGYVGTYSYGFKLKAQNSNAGDTKIFEGYSNSSSLTPYFEITYTNDTDYSLTYIPYKYNNITLLNEEQGLHDPSDTLYNFQNRMNCYAYALQVYYRGYLETGQSYYLRPGEFGISQDDSNNIYKISNYSELISVYNNLEYAMKSPSSYYYPIYYVQQMNLFIDEQMNNDAQALGFDLTRLNINTFSLPNDFDDTSERIIAMFSYYNSFSQVADYHFYARNGNGTCSNHGGNCSIWTHKQGNDPVKNTCASNNNIILCDQNISQYATSLNGTLVTSDINYYIISKDVNIYNSWHGYGQDNNDTGTPYRP